VTSPPSYRLSLAGLTAEPRWGDAPRRTEGVARDGTDTNRAGGATTQRGLKRSSGFTPTLRRAARSKHDWAEWEFVRACRSRRPAALAEVSLDSGGGQDRGIEALLRYYRPSLHNVSYPNQRHFCQGRSATRSVGRGPERRPNESRCDRNRRGPTARVRLPLARRTSARRTSWRTRRRSAVIDSGSKS